MAHNLRHRITRNGHYDLRGHAPIPVVLQTTATQRRKDAAAKRISRKWPIERISKRSRGLRRIGDTCYRLSGLQALLHMPRFLNWISSHNSTQADGTVRFPCRNLDEVGPALVSKLLADHGEDEIKVDLQGCPACIVKRFVEAYWGVVDVTALGDPLPWPHGHVEMAAIRDLDERLYVLTPGAANDTQQDPAECQERLLEACFASTDHT